MGTGRIAAEDPGKSRPPAGKSVSRNHLAQQSDHLTKGVKALVQQGDGAEVENHEQNRFEDDVFQRFGSAIGNG